MALPRGLVSALATVGRALLAMIMAFAGAAEAAPPSVVASILPVHALAAAVGEGVSEPVLIVKGGGSPHTYALRPSEARSLQQADVVFWIGPGLETFLVRPLQALPARARRVALADASAVRLLPYRTGAGWEAHDHDHADEHGRGDDHDHDGARDLHIWLDPQNAAAMADTIVATLAAVDPANAERYRANGLRLRGRLADLETEIAARLGPVRDRPFVVFHDAYQYFEDRFDVRALGSVTLAPERQPGARHLAALRREIARSGAVCVFAEPQFKPALLKTVVEGTEVRFGVLDPIGAGLTPGADAYFHLLRRLAGSLADCLAGSQAQ